jgi:hypothetical protein
MCLVMLEINIETINDAFQNDCKKEETTRILGDIIKNIQRGDDRGNISDTNGNCVGYWRLT